MNRARQNRRTALLLGAAAAGMVGFGFLLVPLYDTFCELTGLNGKTGVIDAGGAARLQARAEERWVTLYLDAATNDSLPWRFYPAERSLRVRAGKIGTVSYWVENRAPRAIVGRAIPSMAPSRAARHFNKIECFCFQEQQLGAGERRELQLRFVIDPELPRDLEVLTLSYTFFPLPGEGDGQRAGAGGDRDDA